MMNNTNEIIQFRLTKSDSIKLPEKNHYKLIHVDKLNYFQYINDINKVISLIKIDLPNWEYSPNYEDVIKRFKSNSICLLLYYQDNVIGWNWGNKNICLDWINIKQKLGVGEYYVGGAFVSKSINRPPNAGLYDYYMMTDYCLNFLNNNVVYWYSESWNKTSIKMSIKIGAKIFN